MQVTGRRPATQFVSLTETVSSKLKDDLKKQHLTLQNVDQYNAVLKSSALLAPEGPCDLVDMHSLSQGEGAAVTVDVCQGEGAAVMVTLSQGYGDSCDGVACS